jgi:hypothetical protein
MSISQILLYRQFVHERGLMAGQVFIGREAELSTRCVLGAGGRR